MERAMLGITQRDRHRSSGIRAKTGVKDIVQVVKKTKMEMGRTRSYNERQ